MTCTFEICLKTPILSFLSCMPSYLPEPACLLGCLSALHSATATAAVAAKTSFFSHAGHNLRCSRLLLRR